MNCCNDCCCCAGSTQPVSTSGRAIDSASCLTSGTLDTVNALIGAGSCILGAEIGAKQAQQTAAVKAQTQLAVQKQNNSMIIMIAIIAVIGFIVFSMPGKK